jgi:hypothetical protein
MAADTARTLREAVTGIQADFPGVRVSQHVSMRVMAWAVAPSACSRSARAAYNSASADSISPTARVPAGGMN